MATATESVVPAVDPSTETGVESADPFAGQRDSNDPFAADKAGNNDEAIEDGVGNDGTPLEGKGRRMSKEWDASKVPPSQFQKRKGSIYATPSSRDGHLSSAERDKAYFEKLKEKGWSVLGKKK
jgi:hypothetical protein